MTDLELRDKIYIFTSGTRMMPSFPHYSVVVASCDDQAAKVFVDRQKDDEEGRASTQRHSASRLWIWSGYADEVRKDELSANGIITQQKGILELRPGFFNPGKDEPLLAYWKADASEIDTVEDAVTVFAAENLEKMVEAIKVKNLRISDVMLQSAKAGYLADILPGFYHGPPRR